MIKLQDFTPEIYYKQSRDFQLLGRLYDVVLNSVKTNADALYSLPIADSTMQTRRLDLLAYTLGFTPKHNYTNTQLAAVCSVFPKLLKLKGSIAAIQLLGDTLLSSEGITDKFNCIVEGTTVKLFVPSTLSSVTLLNDLLDYLLPAGMSCVIARASLESVLIATEVEIPTKVHIFKKCDLTDLSVVPSITDDSKENSANFTSPTNWYTSNETGPDLIRGHMNNSAVLDYGRLTGVDSEGKYSAWAEPQGKKLFYDVIYRIPKVEEGNYSLWAKAAGIGYRQGELAISSDPNDSEYLKGSVGVKLATSMLRIPDKTHLESVYNKYIDGYTLNIFRSNSSSDTSGGISLYDAKTQEIVKILKNNNIEDAPEVETEIKLEFNYNIDANLTTEVLVTESFSANNLGNTIQKSSLSEEAQNHWGNLCISYYYYDKNLNKKLIHELPAFDENELTVANPVLVKETDDDLNTKIYPIYISYFKEVQFTSYQLPRLYTSDGNNLLTGKYDFIITAQLGNDKKDKELKEES